MSVKKSAVNKREQANYENRGQCLKLISTGRCTSRIELSQYTGFSKMAVTNTVNCLIRNKLVSEVGSEETETVGRNPVHLTVSGTQYSIIGLLISRRYCEAVLTDLGLRIKKRKLISYSGLDADQLLKNICTVIDAVSANEKNIIGIGVASIGPIHINKGMILSPHFFYGIHDIPIVDFLKEHYHLPVLFDNNNQCAVLAEKLFGVGKNFNDILLLGISDGVGCGIVSQDKLFGNRVGFAPEFGHVSIDYDGNLCPCGNRGCVETYVRTPVLLDKFRKVSEKEMTYAEYCRAAETDHACGKILKEAVKDLSVAIVAVINILNSELVILSQDACYWPAKYRQILEDTVNENKFGNDDLKIKIRPASFGTDAQLMGAVCLILESVYEGQFPALYELC